jgi:hypothetical protein
MKIGHWHSGVSSKKARTDLKPDTRHLKPMLREGFTTPDNVPKKTYFSSILRNLKSGGSHNSGRYFNGKKRTFKKRVTEEIDLKEDR